jgi:hypothetical protein
MIGSGRSSLHGFLPLLGDDGRLDLATLNVERVRRIAQRAHNLILPITGNGSPSVYFRQKHLGIERQLSFVNHCNPAHFLLTGSF